MSHITKVDDSSILTNLAALTEAVETFCPTLEIVEQTTYRTWRDDHGSVQSEYLSPGWSQSDVGRHAVRVIRVKPSAMPQGMRRGQSCAPYEIGVVPVRVQRDDTGRVVSTKPVPEAEADGYVLMTDWWAEGYGLLKQPGLGGHKRVKDPDTGQVREQMFDQLYMHYRMMEARQAAIAAGDRIEFAQQPDGSWVGTVDTQQRLNA